MRDIPQKSYCPDCGAVLSGTGPCWLCSSLGVPANTPPPLPLRHPAAEERPFQFSLGTLFMAMTVAAVCLGSIHSEPITGWVSTIVAGIAWVRTARFHKTMSAQGVNLSFGRKLSHFVASNLVIFAVLLASAIAFFLACSAGAIVGLGGLNGRNQDAAMFLGLTCGSLAGIAVFIWLLRRKWPSA